jgi:acyl-CoA synthetase (AMP-forming)/AMP-acid ligase II
VNQNIGQLLTRRAYRDPKLEAVYDAGNGKRFSYSQLNANSNRTANAFTDLGLNKGDVVGLLLHNSVEYLESFFAAAKSGLIVVPLNWRLVADELVFILNDAGVKLLLFSDDFSEVASELRRRNTTGITHWIQVDGDPGSRVTAYHDWTGRASDTEPEPAAAGDDLLFIMYTSGTTGLLKGVMQSHNTLL